MALLTRGTLAKTTPCGGAATSGFGNLSSSRGSRRSMIVRTPYATIAATPAGASLFKLSARTTRRHAVSCPDADLRPPRSRAFRRSGQMRCRSTRSSAARPNEGAAQYPRTQCKKNSLSPRGLYADLLFEVRRVAGLSQRQLARRTGIPQPTIASIEAGRRDPRVGTLAKLVDGCGWTLTMVRQKGKGIDRAQIRRLLALTPEERLRRGAAEANRRMIVDKRR